MYPKVKMFKLIFPLNLGRKGEREKEEGNRKQFVTTKNIPRST